LSTLKSGKACPCDRVNPLIPYCKKCCKSGDPSLKVCTHPKFGKILIALRDLPKPYYVAWWGKQLKRKDMPQKHMEWALQTNTGMVDAVPFKEGSMLQFCACSGPNEIPTIDFAPDSEILLKSRNEKMAAVIFRTLRDIPRGHQVTMMYNTNEKTTNEFFKEQGIVRGDVGTPRYPCLRKKRAGGK
ncbi:unnamed protein product, partial [Polarella glacialis]